MQEVNLKEHHLENFDLKDFIEEQRYQSFEERTSSWSAFFQEQQSVGNTMYMREVITPMSGSVLAQSSFNKNPKKMLMFGSNNYLGFADHPYVKEKVKEAIDRYGTGIGGPPLLNGYNTLIKELESRLSLFKSQESALIFPSGYAANLGIFSSIATAKDMVLVDAQHHASCFDGLSLRRTPHRVFTHNNPDELEKLLKEWSPKAKNIFIAVEGVYSMSGDVAPLDLIVEIAKRYNAYVILDDAHGTGVMGPNGKGTAAHFGVEKEISIHMGTMSKTFATAGGFVTGKKETIDFLRFFARSYMFSGSISPPTAATVLAGIDLLEQQPEIHQHLRELITYTSAKLNQIGFHNKIETPIICLPISADKNMRTLAFLFHEAGIFLNAIEYPAVPRDKQCFRVSLSAAHTKHDIDLLIDVVNMITPQTN